MEQIISDSRAEFVTDEPVELDPSLWAQVGGGLPRGTWNTVDLLPRGTWSDVQALPRGTW